MKENKIWKKHLKIIIAPHNIYGNHVSEIIQKLPIKSKKSKEWKKVDNLIKGLNNRILLIHQEEEFIWL